MKYFTYELVAAANDWIEQTDQQRRHAERRFGRIADEYRSELEELKTRLSKPAWQFFRNGFGDTGLHDGQLLSFSIGDGLDYTPDGTSPFRINHQRSLARIEFLNYKQAFHHEFELRGLKRASTNLYVEEDIRSHNRIGDLFIYEMTAANEVYLRLGFLFATGGEIEIEFRRLVYRRHRIRRQYDLAKTFA